MVSSAEAGVVCGHFRGCGFEQVRRVVAPCSSLGNVNPHCFLRCSSKKRRDSTLRWTDSGAAIDSDLVLLSTASSLAPISSPLLLLLNLFSAASCSDHSRLALRGFFSCSGLVSAPAVGFLQCSSTKRRDSTLRWH